MLIDYFRECHDNQLPFFIIYFSKIVCINVVFSLAYDILYDYFHVFFFNNVPRRRFVYIDFNMIY